VGVSAGGAIWSGDGGTLVASGCGFSHNQAIGGSNNTAAATGPSKVGAAERGAPENGPNGVPTVTGPPFTDQEAPGGTGNPGAGVAPGGPRLTARAGAWRTSSAPVSPSAAPRSAPSRAPAARGERAVLVGAGSAEVCSTTAPPPRRQTSVRRPSPHCSAAKS